MSSTAAMAVRCFAAAKAFLRSYPEVHLFIVCFVFFCNFGRVFRRSSVPVDWPLAGMLPGLLLNLDHLHDWCTDLLREVGCNFFFRGPWFLGMDFLFTCDPANLQHVFNANFSNYHKGRDFSEIFDILGDGIFNSKGESWKKQRTNAHGLISDRRFRSFVASSIRNKVEKGLIPFVDEVARRGAVVDLQDVFLRLTFDATSYLAFGVDPCCLSIALPTVPFMRAMDDATSASLLRHTVPPAWWKLARWLRIGDEKKFTMAWNVIDRCIAESIAEKKKLRSLRNHKAGGGEEKADLLSSYINDDDDEEQQDSHRQGSTEFDKFLRDTAINLIFAGRDTTGAALTWFFCLLCNNTVVESNILRY
ncbi:Cytochrome P450 [Musa troglodytarum]|uniref:Cytochrome P450 n=1 Tax=Musa troglodytarum TaxID=320322 RepID=A0A9E7FV11_9LILI|nr:Cytochrome P450 [Musa troglodytarum]